MSRHLALTALALTALALTAPAAASAAEEECTLTPLTACFGLEAVQADLSDTRAGAHPDFTFSFTVAQDPLSEENEDGFRAPFSPTRNVRFELPPGLIGDPNVLGFPQQCSAQELVAGQECPNGSQVGVTTVSVYGLGTLAAEPVYMMQPPDDVVARLGLIAGIYPTLVDLKVRSAGDFGLTAEILDAPPDGGLVSAETTTWGVPAAPTHDTERCTPAEVFKEGCTASPKRPPGSRPLPFMTNPTRCGAPLQMGVAAASWSEPQRFDSVSTLLPPLFGCESLPFGPRLTAVPTNPATSSPTGLDLTLTLPASEGVEVLEPSQLKDVRIDLPAGVAVNPGAADGLAACSAQQARYKEEAPSECPDAAKMATAEFEVGGLRRRLQGAAYLREPEPGRLVRLWLTADDLGVHVKIPAEVEVDEQNGQLRSVVLDSPQVPLREVKLLFKSGLRAPLLTPPQCGAYQTSYVFTPWAGGVLPASGKAPMKIESGCAAEPFSPGFAAGSTDPRAGSFSPFLFTVSRADHEGNLAGLDITLPRGLAASFAGRPRCQGDAAVSGNCPPGSRLGHVGVAIGAGALPLWLPQPGKRQTAIYLSGPYRGAPLSIVAVVPAHAGPFDLGDEVVRSAIHVQPRVAQATAKTDPLPQRKDGIPVLYRTVHVKLDRPGFTLNPTSCAAKESVAGLTSIAGESASPTAPFAATGCSKLAFRPRFLLRLRGGARRGAHPRLRAELRPRPGDANLDAISVTLPRSAFLDQAHIQTVCTRVQFAADQCPSGSIYGHVRARSPLFDEALSGPVYLRSSSHPLPDLVMALRGPDSLPLEIEAVGRIDSVNGGIRTNFSLVPDAPLTSVVVTLKGGSKGLLVNSTNLCAGVNRATAKLVAQNGIRRTLRPVVKPSCPKG